MSSTPAEASAAAGPAASVRTVASAVLRVQMALLDGAAASNEALLHAAASALLSRADYDDVVTERTIADACGNPACPNPLPAAAAAGGPRFHISLREHRVYDLEEARRFCSERCLVASAALAASLPADRPFGVPPERLDAVVALVEGAGAGEGQGLGFRDADEKKKDGGRKLEIKEKEVSGSGEVTLQDWVGPSDAIEGYVPRRDRTTEGQKPAMQNKVAGIKLSRIENVDSRNAAPGEDGMVGTSPSVETHVSSEVIAEKMGNMALSDNTKPPRKETTKTPSKMLKQEEDNNMLSSCISDSIAKQLEDVVLEEKRASEKTKTSKASSKSQKSKSRKRPGGSDGHEVDFTSTIIVGDASTNMEQGTMNQYNYLSSSIMTDNYASSSQCAAKDSTQAYAEQLCKEFSEAVSTGKDETSDEKMKPVLKSSMKLPGSKSIMQSVTWADENGSVLETSKLYESPSSSIKQSEEGIDISLRRASAEACAAALIEAAEAISSGTSEIDDAVSKAGIIILPDMLHQKQYSNDKSSGGDEEPEIDRDVLKWPKKTVLLDTDMFEVDDSWHDTPPEGFSLTLSGFATIWAALFGWISRSSLAYVYGLDGGSVEELLIANGREYPEKIVLKDGHSGEIRRALDTCVCNALPVLVSNLRLQIPVSKLEITLVRVGCQYNSPTKNRYALIWLLDRHDVIF
ncbi:hypothetical protein PVAP13_3NG183884 [Panicum virgatum]|uniref:RNA polymerase II subunit B1 CTD phosphatase RPAP2 homolog n=2 Tax=Panicum virgatum TaxID=38727 RepID=A0A8T0U3H6_PANVG|nr:hypothetical protein PVAP13_3NG183884 [Panicum virgatum]